jgi:hypothetical protein
MRYAPLTITKYPEYAKLYSQVHHIPPKVVIENELLNCAALLENKVRFQKLTVTDARYALLKQYPVMNIKGREYNLNCIPSTGMLIAVHGYKFRASVLDLIRALDGCLWGIPKQNNITDEIQII